MAPSGTASQSQVATLSTSTTLTQTTTASLTNSEILTAASGTGSSTVSTTRSPSRSASVIPASVYATASPSKSTSPSASSADVALTTGAGQGPGPIISDPTVIIVGGASAGAFVCCITVAVTVYCFRCRKRKKLADDDLKGADALRAGAEGREPSRSQHANVGEGIAVDALESWFAKKVSMEAEWAKASDEKRRAEAAGVSQPQHTTAAARVGSPASGGRRASGSVVLFGSTPPGAVVRGSFTIVPPHASPPASGNNGDNRVVAIGDDDCGRVTGDGVEDKGGDVDPVAMAKGPPAEQILLPVEHYAHQQQAHQQLRSQQLHQQQQLQQKLEAQMQQARASNSEERRLGVSTGVHAPPFGGSLLGARRPSMPSTSAAVGLVASTGLPGGVLHRRSSFSAVASNIVQKAEMRAAFRTAAAGHEHSLPQRDSWVQQQQARLDPQLQAINRVAPPLMGPASSGDHRGGDAASPPGFLQGRGHGEWPDHSFPGTVTATPPYPDCLGIGIASRQSFTGSIPPANLSLHASLASQHHRALVPPGQPQRISAASAALGESEGSQRFLSQSAGLGRGGYAGGPLASGPSFGPTGGRRASM